MCGNLFLNLFRFLSGQAVQNFSQSFVIPKVPKLFTNVLVVDIGGASVRAGIASTIGPTLPQIFFPTIMAVERSGDKSPKCFGFDALSPEIRSSCHLSLPFMPAEKIDKMSINFDALCGILMKIFSNLNIDPKDFEIQLSCPRILAEHVKHQIYKLIFEEFKIKSLNLQHQAIFSLNSYNSRTGIIVDLGERMDIVPIIDGYKVSSGVSNLSVGGSQMRQKLQHVLQGRNYSLNNSIMDDFALRHLLESSNFISRQLDLDLLKFKECPEKFNLRVQLSDEGKSVTLGSERFEIGEGLFKPELWGLDHPGIHMLVHKAICECGVDDRKEMASNIFLSGGISLIEGFKERLEAELEKLIPSKPKAHASPYRYHAAFLGACQHVRSDEYQSIKVKRKYWTS